MRFKIDWASLTVGKKVTVFALFYFVLVYKGNFPVQAPPPSLLSQGGLYLEGRFDAGFFCVTSLGELMFGGAYFRNFTLLTAADSEAE